MSVLIIIFISLTLLAITIKVSGGELARFSEGDTTIAFKDGTGYIAEMGVYHELHCIVSATTKLTLLNDPLC